LWTLLFCVAKVELDLSRKEFFRITPRIFSALLKMQREYVAREREHTEVMIGQLTAWTVNTGFRSMDKLVETKDFMPSEWAKHMPKRPREDAFTATMRAFNNKVTKAKHGG
jgi:hypothetical protein